MLVLLSYTIFAAKNVTIKTDNVDEIIKSMNNSAQSVPVNPHVIQTLDGIMYRSFLVCVLVVLTVDGGGSSHSSYHRLCRHIGDDRIP
jgi:hypothetical protein